MIPAPIPENEAERQRCLDELNILDTIEEQAYDDLTFLAAQICQTPIALVSLVDRGRQWFKSHHGLSATETPRELAFCAHAILGDEPLVVEDSLQDTRFHDNPLVTGAPHVHFYAGAPLVLREGIRVGTICVIDDHARSLSDVQRRTLEAIGRQVVRLFELRLQVKELESLDSAKDEFISMVNHELRTPLTSIKGSLALLRNGVAGPIGDKAKQMVDIGYRNTERLLNIVNDILDVAKLEAGKMEMRVAAIDVPSFLAKAIEMTRPFCESMSCQLEMRPTGNAYSLQIMGDEHRLMQVMTNLISNAAKFTHAGDAIEVAARGEGDVVVLSVTDHGPGIAPERQGELFAKFRQLGATSNAKAPGTGLGLNICKLIVEQLGGTISCESAPGKGATFNVSLPAGPVP